MDPHLNRALLLLEQSRYELAEQELWQTLAREPDDPLAHAVLGLCLAEREQFADATREAEQAVHLAPDVAYCHFVHAKVLHHRNHHDEARAAIEEAIRLDPEDADYRAQRSAIAYDRRDWQTALDAAEAGLASEPEHVGCSNLRAMALVKLGRRGEADRALNATLAKEPDNALSHANLGWSLLESGDSKRAMEHFREALRLDPELEWARLGIVESLKARHFIYALMLRYFLWMSRLSGGARWGIVLGAWFGFRIVSSISRSNPELAPWLLPLIIAYLGFVFLSWTAAPLFNLLLRLNRFGRLALSREQIVASNWIGGCVLVSLLAVGAFFATGGAWSVVLAIEAILLVPPLAGLFATDFGWPRRTMLAATLALAAVGVAQLGMVVLATGEPELGLLSLYVLGAFAASILANALPMATVRR